MEDDSCDVRTDLITNTLFSPSSSLARSRNSSASPRRSSTANSPTLDPSDPLLLLAAAFSSHASHSAGLNCGPTSQKLLKVPFAISAIWGRSSPSQTQMQPSMAERSMCTLMRADMTSSHPTLERQRAEEG